MNNSIKIINDFSYIVYKDRSFYFDECRIYGNSLIEFYSHGNFMMGIECKAIEIQQVKNEHYYLKIIHEESFQYDNVVLKLKDDSESNIACHVGDVLIRKDYNSIKDIPLSHITHRNDKLFSDTALVFMAGMDSKENAVNIPSDDEILDLMGWKVIEVLNERIAIIKHGDASGYVLIKNLETLDNIKTKIEEFKKLKGELD